MGSLSEFIERRELCLLAHLTFLNKGFRKLTPPINVLAKIRQCLVKSKVTQSIRNTDKRLLQLEFCINRWRIKLTGLGLQKNIQLFSPLHRASISSDDIIKFCAHPITETLFHVLLTTFSL